MQTEHFYDVVINWDKDRKGTLSSEVLNTTIEVVTPPEFPNGIAGIWSPEHLLVAAVNSCLMTTFLSIASNSKLEFESFNAKASGKLEMIEGKYMISEITLSPVLTIKEEKDRERAARVLQKSEAACLISNSIKSKIIYNPKIHILQE